MILDENKYIKIFTDMMSEGFIVIDKQGIIQIYNKRAMEIFKINQSLDKSHPSGKLEKGDIIIIANNSLGQDDGGLKGEDLSLLGLENIDINEGDAFIAIGQYRYKGIEPIFIKRDRKYKNGLLSYSGLVKNIGVDSDIDFANRLIRIRVEDESYEIKYNNSIGHMVVLDRVTKDVKFFQHYGYTARDESIKNILKGKKYLDKGKNSSDFKLIGKNIKEVNRSNYIIDEFLNIASGAKRRVISKKEEINGIQTLCSIVPVSDKGNLLGAALKVEDITDIEETKHERDQAFIKLKKAEDKLYEDNLLNKAFKNFIGESKEILEVKRLAYRASRSKSNLLLLGESGTGKSYLAKLIHKNSEFSRGPFISVNCGAIAENLLESELFGYEEGAFTGASKRGKKGYFEIADGGSLFLDEIAEIPVSLQAKLLESIQSKTFYRVGGSKKIKVNVRIITATNKNLEEEILAGRFREDLYYRINVLPIMIPSLRERKEDISQLVNILLPRISKELGLSRKELSPEAMKKLYLHSWPGNIRELENVLERAVNLTDHNLILSQDIVLNEDFDDIEEDKKSFQELVALSEKRIIRQTLNIYKGDKQKAMKSLEMSRSNFYKKLKDYDLN